jgi:hypothetical protein
MAAPFYILFLPIAMILGGAVWLFYVFVAHDSNPDPKTRGKSDLQIAQEMEREEDALSQRHA